MKKIVIATAALTLICGAAFAGSSTGSIPDQDNLVKSVAIEGTSTKSGGMTGINRDMKKDRLKRDGIIKGGASKDGSGMTK